MKQHTALYLFLAVGLAACQRGPETTAPTTPAASSTAAPAETAKIAPFKPAQLSVTMTPQGAGALNPATGKFEIPVQIANNGQVILSGATNPPVNVGVQIVPAADGSGGVQDFVRTVLPEIKPGESKVVPVVVPADTRINGHTLKIDLVQEHVAWFASLGQPGTTVGPYEVCGKSLCPVENK